MNYILNSAVLTDFGTYSYQKTTVERARLFISQANPLSTIGYKETAEALGLLLDIPTPDVNRQQIKMQKLETALVFRLTKRVANTEDKGRLSAQFVTENHEIGFLTRVG